MAETLRDKLKSKYNFDIELLAKHQDFFKELKFFRQEIYLNFDRQLHRFIKLLGGKEIVNWDQLKDIKKEDYKNVYALGVPDFEYAIEMKTRLSELEVEDEENDEIPVFDWDCVKARELGIKFLNEKEFMDLIIDQWKSYKPKKLKNWTTPTLPPLGAYEYSPLGYAFLPEAGELFERPATFYVVKIRVPMNDGSTKIVHKPGLAIDNVKGKTNSRYTSKAPLDVAIEIKNLNRFVAKELELRMQAILKCVPWDGSQYPEYVEEQDRIHKSWGLEQIFLDELVGKKINYEKERKERLEILDESFFSRFTPVPNIPDSWRSKYGLQEWRIFDGTDEELEELVLRTLKIVENYFENEGKGRIEHKDFYWGFYTDPERNK